VIITTNYDDLLERALGEAGATYVLQNLEQNLGIRSPSLRLVKLHGSREALRKARQVSSRPHRDGARYTHRYPLGWAQLALYHRGSDTATALPAVTRPPVDVLAPRRRRELVALSRISEHRRVEGYQGVRQLRFGFVGRRAPRAEAIRSWRQGQRLLVVQGLGGLGKSALCTELAPILAATIPPPARLLFRCGVLLRIW
jgi:hypothetical protein